MQPSRCQPEPKPQIPHCGVLEQASLREALDAALEANGDSSQATLFTPREAGSDAELKAAQASKPNPETPRETLTRGGCWLQESEAAAESMEIQLYSLLGSEELKARADDIEPDRLARLGACVTELSMQKESGGTKRPGERLAAAKAAIATCEAILTALSNLQATAPCQKEPAWDTLLTSCPSPRRKTQGGSRRRAQGAVRPRSGPAQAPGGRFPGRQARAGLHHWRWARGRTPLWRCRGRSRAWRSKRRVWQGRTQE